MPAYCQQCGEEVTAAELERVRSDVDFVEHGTRGHLIRLRRPAEVKLTNDGFTVVDDFGPEGRRPVMAGTSPNGPGVVMFSSSFHAMQYADARDRHHAHFVEHGYAGEEYDLRERCKQLVRDYARIVDVTEELEQLVEPVTHANA